MAAGPQSSSCWEALPPDVRQHILRHLPLRDLARAAATSRDFAAQVLTTQAGVRKLAVPAGLSFSATVSGGGGICYLQAFSCEPSRLYPQKISFDGLLAWCSVLVHQSQLHVCQPAPPQIRLHMVTPAAAHSQVGLVSSCRNCHTINLSKMRALTDAQLPSVVVAVAHGARGPRRRVAVEGLLMRGCNVTDLIIEEVRALQAACSHA